MLSSIYKFLCLRQKFGRHHAAAGLSCPFSLMILFYLFFFFKKNVKLINKKLSLKFLDGRESRVTSGANIAKNKYLSIEK